jgi:hypothetical protein
VAAEVRRVVDLKPILDLARWSRRLLGNRDSGHQQQYGEPNSTGKPMGSGRSGEFLGQPRKPADLHHLSLTWKNFASIETLKLFALYLNPRRPM